MRERESAEWYKKWLSGLTESPPESVWENISEELDLDEVWDKVSDELPVKPLVPQYEYPVLSRIGSAGRWAVAVVMLVLLTTPIPEQLSSILPVSESLPEIKTTPEDPSKNSDQFAEIQTEDTDGRDQVKETDTYNKKEERRNNTSYTPSNALAENQSTTIQSQDHDDLYINREPSNIFDAQQATNGIAAHEPREARQDVAGNVTLLPAPESLLAEISQIEAGIIAVNDQADRIESAPGELRKTSEKRKIRFEVGVLSNLNNVWLLNRETQEGLRSQSLIDTRSTYGTDIGAFVHLSTRQKDGVQVEFYALSETGQSYNAYIDALYQTKTIRLEYYKMQILYRRLIFNRFSFLSVYALGGGYLSRLNNAELSIGSSHENVTNQYSSLDYGLTVGLETVIPISRRLQLSPGIRAFYGTRNIFEGNQYLTSDLLPTNSASVGISMAFRYKF